MYEGGLCGKDPRVADPEDREGAVELLGSRGLLQEFHPKVCLTDTRDERPEEEEGAGVERQLTGQV